MHRDSETKGRKADSHYDDPHDATERVDFVLANPRFNVNPMDTEMRVSVRRHPAGTLQVLPERRDHERLKTPSAWAAASTSASHYDEVPLYYCKFF